MELLLDTHTFLWWLDGNRSLHKYARGLIAKEDNPIYVSAASAWEIATKVRIGKLDGARDVAEALPSCLASQGFQPLSITIDHAQRAGALPGPHRDPFDRMLIAQSLAENIPIVSNDRAFDGYGVRRIWSR